ncbi:methyltransferase type 11, partial [Candidatus Parcubacteria bacterium]|nr:methyltransferase type 11 [Candidatus Parcubacteria bacterium]
LAIQEIKRVVRKEGIIIIFVPAFKFLWGITDEISSHYRRYRKKDFVNLAKGNNLEILRFSYFNFFLFAPIALTRLFIRFFSIKINSENDLKFNFINNILYIIFLFESFLLKYINFPFGVSMLLVCKK